MEQRHPIDLRASVAWAASELALDSEGVAAAVERAQTEAAIATVGLEMHHDAPGCDVSVFVRHPAGRLWRWPGAEDAELELGPVDAWEYDITSGGRRAGVFHAVVAGTMPASLERWGRPILVGHLTGRDGQVRFIVPVADGDEHARLGREIAAVGMPDEQVARFAALGPLVTGPDALRLALEYFPDDGRIGSRLGVEVCIDPAVYDVDSVLASVDAEPTAIASLSDVASGLPRRRVRRYRNVLMPAAPIREVHEGIGFHHFSLSWLSGEQRSPHLKSYLVLTSEPPPTPADLRDAAVRRESGSWLRQLEAVSSRLPPRADGETSAESLRAWRAAVSPAGSDQLDVRLQRDGLTEAAAARAVQSPQLVLRADPPWWGTFQRMVRTLAESRPAEVPETVRDVPFAHLFWPVVEVEVDALAERQGGLAPGVRNDIAFALLSKLSGTAAPALLERFWEDVPVGQRILLQSGPEPADPPRERYVRFCRDLQRDGLTSVLTAYPVLGRLLAIAIDQWNRAVSRLLERLDADRSILAEGLGVPESVPLTGLDPSAGDSHNDGEAVVLLRFGEITLVYKPRSVALEALYADVAAELSVRDGGGPLRAPVAVPRRDDAGEYGYVEFVRAQPCEPGEFSTFYRNAGRLLALLHTLSANDCHHENLIATGDQLVLIDAETLLVSQPSPAALPTGESREDSEGDDWSVLHVGMLPSWLWLDGRRTAVDISALGTQPGGLPEEFLGWRSVNSDAMVRARVTRQPAHPTSLPTPPGVPAPLDHHVDDLVDGFTRAYRTLLDGRSTWLDAMLGRVADSENRAVLRPTYVYGTLLGQLLEPSALRSMADHAMVLEKLTRAYLDDQSAGQWPLVRAEMQALERLDVPYFRWPLSSGGTRWLGGSLPTWPEHDQLAGVRGRVARMSDDELARQVALIRASVAAARFRMSSAGVMPRAEQEPLAEALAGPTEPEAVARAAFAALSEARLEAHGDPSWMGLALLPDGMRANVQTLGSGLYDGLLGVAVGYRILADASPNSREAADRNSHAAQQRLLRAFSDDAVTRGLLLAHGAGLAGAGGWLRGLMFLADRGDSRPELLRSVSSVVDAISADWLRGDPRVDVMAGPAGLVTPLVRMLDDPGRWGVSRPALLELISAAAASLAERQDGETGGWRTLAGAPPLSGLAHGASGMALALAEAGVALGDERLIADAARGLAYEATLFDPEAGNWLDLRPTSWSISQDSGDAPSPGFMMGWCAGAPGIALARWRLLRLLPSHPDAALWRDDLRVAAQTTASAPLMTRDHLCCGNLGRAAILRTIDDDPHGHAHAGVEVRAHADVAVDVDVDASVGAASGNGSYRHAADRLVGAVVDQARSSETGLPRSVLGTDIPGLPLPAFFTGLSGIGTALLDDAGWARFLLL